MLNKIILFLFLLNATLLVAQVQEPGTSVYTNTKNNAVIYGGDMQYALGVIGGEQHWGIELRVGRAVMDELVLSSSYRYQRLFKSGFSSFGVEGRYYITKLTLRPVVKLGANYVFGIRTEENVPTALDINAQFEFGGGLSYLPLNSRLGVDVLYHYWSPQQLFTGFDSNPQSNHSGIVATAFLLIN